MNIPLYLTVILGGTAVCMLFSCNLQNPDSEVQNQHRDSGHTVLDVIKLPNTIALQGFEAQQLQGRAVLKDGQPFMLNEFPEYYQPYESFLEGRCFSAFSRAIGDESGLKDKYSRSLFVQVNNLLYHSGQSYTAVVLFGKKEAQMYWCLSDSIYSIAIRDSVYNVIHGVFGQQYTSVYEEVEDPVYSHVLLALSSENNKQAFVLQDGGGYHYLSSPLFPAMSTEQFKVRQKLDQIVEVLTNIVFDQGQRE